MDFRLLRYFLRVASEGSISRAAASLHISQPPLSQAIAALEENLGQTLFIREPRGVRLTQVGAQFAERAERLLSDLDELEELTRHGYFGAEGQLRIACVPTVSWLVLPRLLRTFAAQYENVKLDLDDPPPLNAIESVLDGSADIGIIATLSHEQLNESYRSSLEVFFVETMPLLVALPSDFAPDDERVSLVDLHEENWILPRRSLRIRGLPELFDEIWHTHKLTPPAVQRVRTLQTAVPLVQAGLGVSLMPREVLRASSVGMVLKEPVEAVPPLVVALFYSKQRPLSVAAERFVALATGQTPSGEPGA